MKIIQKKIIFRRAKPKPLSIRVEKKKSGSIFFKAKEFMNLFSVT